MKRWKQRPEGSNWGDFGDDDQLGRLNLLTPAKVRQGVAEVREGLTFCLSLPLDYPGGESFTSTRRSPPVLRPVLLGDAARGVTPKSAFFQQLSANIPGAAEVFCDDLVILHLQYSSQWDALSHCGHMFDADGDGTPEMVFYNGYRAGVDVLGSLDPADCGPTTAPGGRSTSEARKLGIENMAAKCVQGRGVMVDLFAHYGKERKYVGYDQLMSVLEQDHVEIEPGDIVCFHTGIAQMLLDMKKHPDRNTILNSCAELDGSDERLLQWITDTQIVALIADNKSVEAIPARAPGRNGHAPLHTHCIFKLGMHLGEFWHLTELANWLRRHKRSRFLLTGQPLRLPGAVGSPPAPVATV